MTRYEKLSALATYLNCRIDVPLLPEVLEQQCFQWLANKLAPLLTDTMLDLMLAVDGGLSDVEIGFFEPILANYLDHLVDVPFVPDTTEAGWSSYLSRLLLDLLRKGTAVPA